MKPREFATRVTIAVLCSGMPEIALNPAQGALIVPCEAPIPGISPASTPDEGPPEIDDAASKANVRPRLTPWTTSKIRGTPEPPPPYRVEPAFPRLRFNHPIALTSVRGLDRIFLAELGGKIYSFPCRPDVEVPDLAIDL